MKMNIMIVDTNDSYDDYDGDNNDVNGDITLSIFMDFLFYSMSHLFINIIGWKYSSHDG